jgi:uncharacterized YigZ family protein
MEEKREDIYYTIEEQVRAEIKIKSSKFIATAIPISSKEDAMEILGTIRTEFYDATHNCYSYRIGSTGMEFRYSDDGEPNSSAGKPILFAIKKFDLTDILVVVTRYFGGTKLGVGGLARAYGDATEAVLEIAKKKEVFITKLVRIYSTYEDINAVKQLVLKTAKAYDEYYHDSIEILASIPITKIDSFVATITEITAGRAGAIILDSE